MNPLIEAAVAPLSENAEHRLAVTSILAETADREHPGAAEAIARWKSVDGKRHPFLWKPVLYVASAVAMVLMVVSVVPEIRLFWAFENSSYSDAMTLLHPKGLTQEEELLLGNPSQTVIEQKDALRRSDPDNPAFYAEYAKAYISEYTSLPDDYFETAARIAPRNSYFLYLAARPMKYDVIERGEAPSPKPARRIVDGVTLRPLPVETDFIINDQSAYEKSLALLEKAAALPEFDSYETALLAPRIRASHEDGAFVQRVHEMLLFYNVSNGLMSFRKIADVLSARAQQLSRNGDKEGFLALVEMRHHLINGMANRPDSILFDELVLRMVAAVTADYFLYAAERLELDELAEGFRKESEAFQASSDRPYLRNDIPEEKLLGERRGFLSILSWASPSRVDSPPPLTAADLAPHSYAEHDLAMRLGLVAVALIMLLAALPVFLFRFIFPPPLRLTAARFVQLLRASDWIVAITLGVLLPIAAILLLNRFTELGGRERGLYYFHFLFPGVHLVAIVLLLLLAPAIFIRWRLAKWVAPLGISCRPGIISIIAILGIIVLAVLAYPVVLRFGMEMTVLKALAAAPALWLATVLGNLLRAIIGKPSHRISLAATSIALLPAYAAAILAISATLPFLIASEKHWFAQDTVMNPDPDAPDFGMYEFRIASQMRRETREILGLEN